MSQVLIIITNGESMDTTCCANIAEFARSQGWKVIGLFVGAMGTPGYQKMLRISSVAQNVQELRASNFTELEFRATPLAIASLVASVDIPGCFTTLPSSLFLLSGKKYPYTT